MKQKWSRNDWWLQQIFWNDEENDDKNEKRWTKIKIRIVNVRRMKKKKKKKGNYDFCLRIVAGGGM